MNTNHTPLILYILEIRYGDEETQANIHSYETKEDFLRLAENLIKNWKISPFHESEDFVQPWSAKYITFYDDIPQTSLEQKFKEMMSTRK